jgi:hypothetical protein
VLSVTRKVRRAGREYAAAAVGILGLPGGGEAYAQG